MNPTAPIAAKRLPAHAQQLQGWLKQEGFAILDIKVEGDPPADWAFGVAFSPSVGDTTQPKAPIAIVGRDYINRVDAVLQAGLSPEHKKLLNGDGLLAKGATRQIREALILHGTGLAFRKGADGQIDSMSLDEVVYADAPLTRDRFMTSLRRLYAALLYASDTMSRAANPKASGIDVFE